LYPSKELLPAIEVSKGKAIPTKSPLEAVTTAEIYQEAEGFLAVKSGPID